VGILLINSIMSFLANIVLFCGVPFLWWLIFHRKKTSLFKFVGLQKPVVSMPVWVILVFIVGYVLFYKFGGNILNPLIDEGTQQVISKSDSMSGNAFTGLGMVAVPAALVSGLFANGFCEEVLFRGFILKRFKARVGTAWAIIITAILFGLLHNTFILLAGIPVGFGYHIMTFTYPFIVGILLGFANEKLFGGSIWPSILLHGLGNSVSFINSAFK